MSSHNETTYIPSEPSSDDSRHAAPGARRSPREALSSVRRASRRVLEDVAVRGRRLEVKVERRLRPTLIRVTGQLSQAAAAVQKRLDALRDRLEAAQERSAEGASKDVGVNTAPLPGAV